MLVILFAVGCLASELYLNNQMSTGSLLSEKVRRRTEAEWICTRCRLPAEGSYCTRCGQTYERPTK
jgi:hypothetical protein